MPPSCLRYAVKDDINVLRNSTKGLAQGRGRPLFLLPAPTLRTLLSQPVCSRNALAIG